MARGVRRAAATAVLAMVAALAVVGLVATPALAFTISPPSATVQGGQDYSASLTDLPITAGNGPACLEVAGGNPSNNTISITFAPDCSQQAGWSSTMNIITIPGTPAGSYQITVEDCASPSCDARTGAGNIGNQTPIQTQTWTLNVTPGLPIQATTPPITLTTPPETQPPPSQSPVPQPSKTAKPAATTSAKPATSPAAPPVASPSPAASVPAVPTTPAPVTSAAGNAQALAGSLVLSRSSVPRGGTVGVSGSGCT
ncbi:MAG: hypothetical protein ACRDJU_05265, partial [Actinomycetota bacterium]